MGWSGGDGLGRVAATGAAWWGSSGVLSSSVGTHLHQDLNVCILAYWQLAARPHACGVRGGEMGGQD